MAFRTLDDIKPSAKYQQNLRQALVAAHTETMKFAVWESFPFTEQTAPLIIVAPDIESSLVRKISDMGARKLADGQCRAVGRKLMLKPAKSISASAINLALKIAKVSTQIEVVDKTVDLDAAVQAGAREQTREQGEPAAEKAQEKARAELRRNKAYATLIARVEAAHKASRDKAEQATLVQVHTKFRNACKANDFVLALSLAPSIEKVVTTIEERIRLRDKQQAEHAQRVKQLQQRYADAMADLPAEAADAFKAVTKAWGDAAALAAQDEYVEAGKALDKVPILLDKVEESVRAAWRKQLAEERAAAEAQLSPITAGEKEALEKLVVEAEQQIAKYHAANVQKALAAIGEGMTAFIALRNLRKTADELCEAAAQLLQDQQANLSDKPRNSAEAAINNAKSLRDQAKDKVGSAATTLLKSACIAAKKAVATITKALNDREQNANAALEAANAFHAAVNRTATEDEAAKNYGNGRFTSGILADIWKAVLRVRGDNPPNGSIAGVRSLSDVEAAIKTWRGTSASGVLTNFHVPGGRPQAKWQKNFVRHEIQANFCVRWRGQNVNIHVTVDPKSYFAKYGDEVDWTQIPQDIRKSLGR